VTVGNVLVSIFVYGFPLLTNYNQTSSSECWVLKLSHKLLQHLVNARSHLLLTLWMTALVPLTSWNTSSSSENSLKVACIYSRTSSRLDKKRSSTPKTCGPKEFFFKSLLRTYSLSINSLTHHLCPFVQFILNPEIDHMQKERMFALDAGCFWTPNRQ